MESNALGSTLPEHLTHPYGVDQPPLIAKRFKETLPSAPGMENTLIQPFLRWGRTLWEHATRALNFWTPERAEDLAIHRASGMPVPQTIAEEVRAFTELLHQWQGRCLDWFNSYEGMYTRNALHTQHLIWETIGALERRSAAVEARVTDLRLQHSIKSLGRLVAERDLVREVTALIGQAGRENEDELRARLEGLDRKIERLVEQSSTSGAEIAFIADLVMQDFAQNDLGLGKPLLDVTRKNLARLGTVATNAFAKALFSILLKQWLGMP